MKRLFIDLEKAKTSKDITSKCSYSYHPSNDGVSFVREYANYALICRKCEAAPCVTSCPKDALEKQDDDVLKRYNFRCVSCKSCSHACPFGTIFPELIPYKTSMCDFCIDRLKSEELPLCVRTCRDDSIKYEEVKESEEKGIYFIGGNLAVRSLHWVRV